MTTEEFHSGCRGAGVFIHQLLPGSAEGCFWRVGSFPSTFEPPRIDERETLRP